MTKRLCLLFYISGVVLLSCTSGEGRDVEFEPGKDEAEVPAPSSAKKSQAPAEQSFRNTSYHLFIETSGSMEGYFNGLPSQFSNALSTLVSDMDAARSDGLMKSMHLNYLGGTVSQSSNRLIDDINDKFSQGNFKHIKTNSSNFDQFFDQALQKVSDTGVSILVSDLIFSPPKQFKQQVDKFLDHQRDKLKTLFDTKLDARSSISTLIIQLHGNFDGTYTDKFEDPTTIDNKARPFYIVVIGNHASVTQLLSLIDITKLPGYRNSFLLEEPREQKVKAKLSASAKYKKEDYDIQGAASDLHVIRAQPDDSRTFQFAVLMDLSEWSFNESMVGNKLNYQLSAGSQNYDVVNVVKLSSADLVQKSNQGYTHVLVLSTRELQQSQKIQVSFKSTMPAWVQASSTDDDRKTAVDASLQSKTYGLTHLLGGIQNAYDVPTRAKPLFHLNIHIER